MQRGDDSVGGLGTYFDVCHNIAKLEEHAVGGKRKRLWVHRKGATRAFPPEHPEIPANYRKTGQPVIIPGDMGRGRAGCSSASPAAWSRPSARPATAPAGR